MISMVQVQRTALQEHVYKVCVNSLLGYYLDGRHLPYGISQTAW